MTIPGKDCGPGVSLIPSPLGDGFAIPAERSVPPDERSREGATVPQAERENEVLPAEEQHSARLHIEVGAMRGFKHPLRDLGLLEARFCLCPGSADQPPCENRVDGSDDNHRKCNYGSGHGPNSREGVLILGDPSPESSHGSPRESTTPPTSLAHGPLDSLSDTPESAPATLVLARRCLRGRVDGEPRMIHPSRKSPTRYARTILTSSSSNTTTSATAHARVHQFGPPATTLATVLNAATPATIVMRLTLLRFRLHARSPGNMGVCGDRVSWLVMVVLLAFIAP